MPSLIQYLLFGIIGIQHASSEIVGYFAADGFVVQTGDPEGPAEGFIDPGTGKAHIVPLEIMVDGHKASVYGETLEICNSYSPIYSFIHSFHLY
jgi:hypothetical protein